MSLYFESLFLGLSGTAHIGSEFNLTRHEKSVIRRESEREREDTLAYIYIYICNHAVNNTKTMKIRCHRKGPPTRYGLNEIYYHRNRPLRMCLFSQTFLSLSVFTKAFIHAFGSYEIS